MMFSRAGTERCRTGTQSSQKTMDSRRGRRLLRALPWLCMAAVQAAAVRYGYGVPAFLVLAMVAIVVFGTREKAADEVSAYSVFNKGHSRLAGEFTAAQFDAQLRGTAAEHQDLVSLDAASRGTPLGPGHRLGGTTVAPPATEADATARRRLLARAAERRFQRERAADTSLPPANPA
mmetsp:Transcript_888/g.2498  ORF Transcript_888/g.2498 Transcript_888/m.2498 type:complete len:177 (-) Transcript_888:91-621(-)